VMGDDEIYPDHQLAVVLYAGDFIKREPQAAAGFMRAYIRAVRDYNDALNGGHIAGPNAGEIIAILTEYTDIKDPAVYRAMHTQGTNPNGRVHEASLKQDLQFFKEEGLIEGNVTVDQALEHSFADAAVKALGPYQPKAMRK